MSTSLGEMVVSFNGDTSGLRRSVGEAKNLLTDFGRGGPDFLKGAAVAFAATSVAAVAAGVAVSKMAGDYQAGLLRLYTTAGESKSNLQMVGRDMLDMSVQVGTGAQTLENAMYFVESAGAHGKTALTDLKIAAMGAKDENANLTDVVKTEMFTLNSYAGTGLTAAGAMNTLIAAVSQGTMTLQDLSSSLSNVLPASSKFHISLIDTAGAIAEMTKQGDDAASAATHLRQMILALEAPAKAGAKALADIGLTTQQVSDAMKQSLPGALQLITDHLAKKFPEGSAAYNEALKNIAGGSKQMMGMLELTGNHLKDFTDITVAMTGQVKAGGQSIMGWADVQKTFNFQMDQTKAALEAVGIKVGTELMPIVADFVSHDVLPAIQAFSDWATHSSTLRDSFQTVLDVVGSLIKDTESLVGWFIAGGPVVQTVTQAVLFLGGALIALKVADTVASFATMFSKITAGKGIIDGFADSLINKVAPNLSKVAGKASDACDNVGCIGENAKTSAADVSAAAATEEGDLAAVSTQAKTAGTDMAAIGTEAEASATVSKGAMASVAGSITGVLGPLALLVAGFAEVAATPTGQKAFFPDKKDQYPAPPGFIDLITHMGDIFDPKKLAQDFKDLLQPTIKDTQTLAENASLVAENLKHAKAGIDDLGHTPGVHIVDGDIIKLGTDINKLPPVNLKFDAPGAGEVHNKLLALNDIHDHLQKPVNIPLDVPGYDSVHNKLLNLNTGHDHLQQPVNIPLVTPDYDTVHNHLLELNKNLNDASNTRNINVNSGSLDTALGKANNLLNLLAGVGSAIANVGGSSSPGTSSFRGYASGGDFGPGWFTAGEHGIELIHAGGPGHVYNAAQTAGMLGGGEIHVHNENHIYLDSYELTEVVGRQFLRTIHKTGPVKSGVAA